MTDPGAVPLHEHLVERIHRHGPLPFSVVMDLALYDPEHGFFGAGGGSAGRRGDFITSPEIGPLFGVLIARALDTWWDELGRPDPYVVVDAGAGVGTLAVTVLAASPRCAGALHYVLVERSPVLRDRHGDHLALSPPATSLGVPGAGDGPVVVSLAELPATSFTGVVLANELLDNLAVDLLVRISDGWGEVRIGLDETADRSHLVRHVVPASEPAVVAADRLAPKAPVDTIVPWQRQAATWVRDALALLDAGRVVVFDYAVETTAQLVGRPISEWLRTYRGHERAGDPLESIGQADITVEVCIDQLSWSAGEPASVQRQADWLRVHGIDELVEEGKRIWHERAHLGDLEAIRGRSRVTEAEALCDPDGLGAFRVIEWSVG